MNNFNRGDIESILGVSFNPCNTGYLPIKIESHDLKNDTIRYIYLNDMTKTEGPVDGVLWSLNNNYHEQAYLRMDIANDLDLGELD